MKKNLSLIILTITGCVLAFGSGVLFLTRTLAPVSPIPQGGNTIFPTPTLAIPTPTTIPASLPQSKTIPNNYHIFQSFNNCGPAAFSMALSYYGITKSQQELGRELRPYQNPQGDNDDKSVTLEELAEKSKEYGFIPYLRPQGTPEIIKQFIAIDIPVITRTLLHMTDDIGHYRVIKGYTDQTFIQDDSLQGKNLSYSYTEFDTLWKQFGYEYLVLVPREKQALAEQIIGTDLDEKTAWTKAMQSAQKQIAANPADSNAYLNLSVAAYHIGEYQKSTEAFEKVEGQLSFRTLWYQIEPILSYYELGKYDRVFSLTDKILNNHNRAFSEVYYLRGQVYLKQNKPSDARAEFEKALFYNTESKQAQEALR